MLGNKTEQYVRNFFANYRKRYNLDHIIKEWERYVELFFFYDGGDLIKVWCFPLVIIDKNWWCNVTRTCCLKV